MCDKGIIEEQPMKQSPRKRMKVCTTARSTKDVLGLCGSLFFIVLLVMPMFILEYLQGKIKHSKVFDLMECSRLAI